MKLALKLCSVILLSSISTFSQSNFTKGFNNGYKEGFCHDQGIGCIVPTPPIVPTPNIYEKSASYSDGYNRGFKTGLKARENETNEIERSRFKTAEPEFIDGIYEPNLELKYSLTTLNSEVNSKKEYAIKALKNKIITEYNSLEVHYPITTQKLNNLLYRIEQKEKTPTAIEPSNLFDYLEEYKKIVLEYNELAKE